MMPPSAFFELRINQNAYAAGASPLTILRGYRAPRPPRWFSGNRFAAGEGRKGRGREEGGKGKG